MLECIGQPPKLSVTLYRDTSGPLASTGEPRAAPGQPRQSWELRVPRVTAAAQRFQNLTISKCGSV